MSQPQLSSESFIPPMESYASLEVNSKILCPACNIICILPKRCNKCQLCFCSRCLKAYEGINRCPIGCAGSTFTALDTSGILSCGICKQNVPLDGYLSHQCLNTCPLCKVAIKPSDNTHTACKMAFSIAKKVKSMEAGNDMQVIAGIKEILDKMEIGEKSKVLDDIVDLIFEYHFSEIWKNIALRAVPIMQFTAMQLEHLIDPEKLGKDCYAEFYWKKDLKEESNDIEYYMSCKKNNSYSLNVKYDSDTAYNIIAEPPLTKKGEYYWEIACKMSLQIGIGVTFGLPLRNKMTNYLMESKCFFYYPNSQRLSNEERYGPSDLRPEAKIGVYVNMNIGTIGFTVNDENYGPAYNGKEIENGPLYPAIIFLERNEITTHHGFLKRPNFLIQGNE